MARKYLFQLYLSSRSFSNEKICENLKLILDEKLKDQYSLEIIFVTEDVESVLQRNIFTTPTLIKKLPSPSSTVVGDLSDREKLSAAVEISLK